MEACWELVGFRKRERAELSAFHFLFYILFVILQQEKLNVKELSNAETAFFFGNIKKKILFEFVMILMIRERTIPNDSRIHNVRRIKCFASHNNYNLRSECPKRCSRPCQVVVGDTLALLFDPFLLIHSK